MSKDLKLRTLRNECLKLFDLRDHADRYEEEAYRLSDRIVELGLDDVVDDLEFRFVFGIKLKSKIRSLSLEEFTESVRDFLRIRKTDFYFQIPELEGFPPAYAVGHGALLPFSSLPEEAVIYARALARGEPLDEDPERSMWIKEAAHQSFVPPDPEKGQWFRITTSAVSHTIRRDVAFGLAEESIDILRITNPAAAVRLPRYAIEFDADTGKAFLVATVRFSRFSYGMVSGPGEHELIRRLSEVCVNPSSDLERRIKDALHFYRIGELHAAKHQKLFFYVAGIERLILGREMNLTHKFKERGAILLGRDPDRRLELSGELGEMYNVRSEIAHGEITEYNFSLESQSRNTLRNLVVVMLNLIKKKGLRTVSPKARKNGTSLEEYIDGIIYSG